MMMVPAATASSLPPANELVLRDIHLPASPSWWPPAPGWWVLAGLLLLLSLAMILWLWRRGRRQQQRQARILREIDRLAQLDDDAALAAALHQWLRRAARTYAADAAQQRGEAWRQTLAQVPVDPATLDHLLRLEQRMYQPTALFERAATLAAVRRWMVLALRQRPGQRKLHRTATESADA